MNYIEPGNARVLREVEADVKNRFRWDWLDHKVDVEIRDGVRESVKLGDHIKKPDIAGKAYCCLCNALINYGKRGRVALVEHVKFKKHKAKMAFLIETRNTNYTLGSCVISTPRNQEEGAGPSVATRPPTPLQKRLVPLTDRVTHLQGLVLGTLAEHSLPFTMAPVIINTAKALAADPKALDSLSMDRTSASYKLRFGVAKTFTEEIEAKLQSSFFSFNIDEATSSNNMKVLAVLVSYFSPTSQRVVIEHLTSVSMIKVNSLSLMKEMEDIMKRHNLPWTNLMSVLMDSCNVMRGSKSGLEVRLREKAPHLLDIDGDVCHHMHNASKQFCKPFDCYLEGWYGYIHADLKWSTDSRDALANICFLLGMRFTMPDRFVSHRWLSCYDVTISTLRLWDALLFFYFAYMKAEDKIIYRKDLDNVLEQREISKDSKSELFKIIDECSKKNMTTDGQKRKQVGIERLFYSQQKTQVLMNLYSGVLPLLKRYVCLFESKVTQVHKLNDEQIQMYKDFLACFVKPEVYTNLRVRELTDPDQLNIADKTNHLSHADMFTGSTADKNIPRQLLQSMEEGYVKCGVYLQAKLPLKNPLLRALSALDPLARGHSTCIKHLNRLPVLVTNIITEEQLADYNLEVRAFQVNHSLPPHVVDGNNVNLDEWWAGVSNLGSFPLLSKMAKALMSCFHGPSVEGSFNIMGDILDPKSARTKIETYSAVQTVKYTLRASEQTALQMFKRPDIRHDPVNAKMCQNIRSARKHYNDELAKNREVLTAKRAKLAAPKATESKVAAKLRVSQAQLAARQAHRRRQKLRLEQLAEAAKRRRLQKNKNI